MQYKFTITNRGKSYSEIYDIDGIDNEWLENYTEAELVDKEIRDEYLDNLNGKHIVFDIVESLMQSDVCMPWMESGNNQYKFEKLP